MSNAARIVEEIAKINASARYTPGYALRLINTFIGSSMLAITFCQIQKRKDVDLAGILQIDMRKNDLGQTGLYYDGYMDHA